VDTIRRGNAAEAAVLHRLVCAEIPVYLPFGGGSAVDLLALVPPDGRVVRIQVKSGRVREGCVRFNAYSTDHGAGQQTYHGRADVIAVHVRKPDAVFIVPVDGCPTSEGSLRLDLPRNNQRQRIRFAADYSFDNWVRLLGDWRIETPRPPELAFE
jgi:PD-(D/E)XK endonuclease